MKKTLITGVTGFTGHYLAKELAAYNYQIVGLTHSVNRSLPSGVSKLHVVDLLNANSLNEILKQEKPDVVIHLAAISFVAHSDVEAIYRTNVVGTRNLLQAIAQISNIEHVLLASSANVYGNSAAEIITENVLPKPTNDYAVSKLAMEQMAALWTDRIPITIVRPFNYTGAGQSEQFLIPKIVKHFARKASQLELGNIDVERDFSDVRAVVNAYRCLLQLPGTGKIYNICSGQGYTLMQVIAMMEELSGFRPEICINPAFVRTNEVKRLIGDNQRLKQAINEYYSIELKDTLAWMLQYFLNQSLNC
jgi:nucleoside-diphosphate-sugar epimerase